MKFRGGQAGRCLKSYLAQLLRQGNQANGTHTRTFLAAPTTFRLRPPRSCHGTRPLAHRRVRRRLHLASLSPHLRSLALTRTNRSSSHQHGRSGKPRHLLHHFSAMVITLGRSPSVLLQHQQLHRGRCSPKLERSPPQPDQRLLPHMCLSCLPLELQLKPHLRTSLSMNF